MRMSPTLMICLLLLQLSPASKAPQKFYWDWRHAQEIPIANSLRVAKMSKSDKAAIAGTIEAQFRSIMSDFDLSNAHLMKLVYDTRIEMVDLNGDGTPEVIAQGMGWQDCGAVGNCSFWVFQKKRRGYRLLLNGGAKTFLIQSKITNGFKEIISASHDSAAESDLVVYHYEGGAYKAIACYDANFAPHVTSVLKEPEITPESCN